MDFSKSEFTIELKAILEKAKAPQKFIDYLVTNGMEEVTDLALMCPDDALLNDNISTPAGIPEGIDTTRTKRAWLFARISTTH